MFPSTRLTLLSRMRKGDDNAWTEFVGGYTVPVLGFLCRFGLSAHDAEDLAQEAFLKLNQESLRAYQADKGRFRSWLMTLLRHQFLTWRRQMDARKRGRNATDSGDEPRSPDDPEGAVRWDQLETQVQEDYLTSRKAIQESLDRLLQDYPKAQEKNIYLDWFWNDADLTDKDLAARHQLEPHELRYLRKKIETHLRKRWEKESER